jgi:hypothetical protein
MAVQNLSSSKNSVSKARVAELTDGLRRHLTKVKPIVYISLLAVGIPQIVLREYFPELMVPWGLICYPLMVVLFAIIFVPPLLLIVRWRKKTEPDRHDQRP